MLATVIPVAGAGAGAAAATAVTRSAVAATKAINLDGESFSSTSATLIATPTGGDPYCGATQQGAVSFTTSGTATGTYPGTFTETGHWDFDLITEQTFDATFTITSGPSTISGSILYDQTSTGPDGRSLVQNYGSCDGSQSGGAYTVCANDVLTGICAGQAVAFVSAGGLTQVFEHPTGRFHMTITGGNAQSAMVNSEFGQPLSVRVTDSMGAPVGGVAVRFVPARRNPTATPQGPWAATDWDGTTSMNMFASPVPGTYHVAAKSAKGATAVFTLSNTP